MILLRCAVPGQWFVSCHQAVVWFEVGGACGPCNYQVIVLFKKA
jgi:hypothetical protein